MPLDGAVNKLHGQINSNLLDIEIPNINESVAKGAYKFLHEVIKTSRKEIHTIVLVGSCGADPQITIDTSNFANAQIQYVTCNSPDYGYVAQEPKVNDISISPGTSGTMTIDCSNLSNLIVTAGFMSHHWAALIITSYIIELSNN